MGIKELAVSRGNLLWFKRDQLWVEPGWNERDRTPELEAHIRSLADLIIEHGYLQTKPISVKLKKIDGVDRVVIRDGHNRYEAVEIAEAETGKEILIAAVSLPPGLNDFDELVQQLTSNSGKPNTPIEQARIIQRMMRDRPELKTGDIAKLIGVSRQTVENAIDLLELPLAIQRMINESQISATFAIAFAREHGDRAVALLEEKLALLELQGKSKVTAKHFQESSAAEPAAKPVTSEPISTDTPVTTEPESTAEPLPESPKNSNCRVETDSNTIEQNAPKKPSLRQLAKDIVQSSHVGECTHTHKWVGIEVDLWKQLLELIGESS